VTVALFYKVAVKNEENKKVDRFQRAPDFFEGTLSDVDNVM